jgi:lysozyme
MRVSEAGRADIKLNEGKRLFAYQDGAGIYTIGVGHAATNPRPVRGILKGEFYEGRPCAGLTITPSEADRLFSEDLAEVEAGVSALITVACPQGVFDAICDMGFQFGVHRLEDSGVIKAVNFNPRSTRVMDQIMRWVRVGGKPNKGLYMRRCRNVCRCWGLDAPKILANPKAFPWAVDASGEIAAGTMPVDMVLAMARDPDLPAPAMPDPVTLPTPAPEIDLPTFEAEPEAETVVVASAAAESVESVSSAPLPTQPEAAKPAPAPVPDSPPAIQATTVTVQPIAGPPVTLAPNIAPSIVNTPLGPVSSDGKDWYRSQTVMGGILQAGARIVGRVKVGTAVPGALAALAVNDPVVQALAVTIIMIAVVYCVEHWGEWTAHRGRKKADHNQPLRRA